MKTILEHEELNVSPRRNTSLTVVQPTSTVTKSKSHYAFEEQPDVPAHTGGSTQRARSNSVQVCQGYCPFLVTLCGYGSPVINSTRVVVQYAQLCLSCLCFVSRRQLVTLLIICDHRKLAPAKSCAQRCFPNAAE
jgi:hypothetical protein